MWYLEWLGMVMCWLVWMLLGRLMVKVLLNWILV